MDKSGKLYVKAMNKYNDGHIDKALDLCEKSISKNSSNAAALNLKGILYYLKGDLESAKKMWNISYKRNNDEVSKKYLRDAVNDKENLKIYIIALDLIKQLNISGALEVLKQCENSHFNIINVNNQISLCYIKQGEYDKALRYIIEVLKIDKKNNQAIMNKKVLMEYGSLKKEINYKKISVITVCLFLMLSLLFLRKSVIHNAKDISLMGIKKMQSGIAWVKGNKNDEIKEIENNKESNTQEVKKNIEVKKSDIVKSEEKLQEKKVEQVEKFPQELFEKSITSNNMEQVIMYVNTWNDKDLNMNQKLLVVKGREVIENSGVKYFYQKGTGYIKDEKFIEARKCFLDVLPYSEGNYLQESIIYMLALSYKGSSDFENAIKYYDISLEKFPSGTYKQETLYNLILINKDVNMDKAKIYAQRLNKEFPKSQYNNSIVKNILK